jgi:hypothetical protein
MSRKGGVDAIARLMLETKRTSVDAQFKCRPPLEYVSELFLFTQVEGPNLPAGGECKVVKHAADSIL